LTRPKRGSGADPCPFFLVVLVEEVVREAILEGCVLLCCYRSFPFSGSVIADVCLTVPGVYDCSKR
jgi:hypothetical protein